MKEEKREGEEKMKMSALPGIIVWLQQDNVYIS